MKINNLKVGQVIKNYKELCEILDIESKKSGSNSHKAQHKEFNRYFEFEKQGHKYIIKNIHDKPKDKIDNRSNNIGGNNTVFADDIEKLILNILASSKDDTITIARGQLYKMLNMCNENYLLGRSNIGKLSEIIELPKSAIYEFYDNNSSKLRDTVERNLRRLRSRALITWKNTTTVAVTEVEIEYNELGEPIFDKRTKSIRYKTKMVHRLADKFEEKLILKYEEETLKEMGIDTIQKVFLLGKWKYFKQQVENKLKENDTNIDYYYDSYTITFNNDSVKNYAKKLSDNSIKDIKNNINHNMVESIKKSTMKRHNKACLESGLELNHFKQDKLFQQEKIDYVIEQEQLTFTLISNKAPSLKNKFEKTIDYKKLKEIDKNNNTEQVKFAIGLDEEIPF